MIPNELPFPTGLSDEAAVALCDFLNELAAAADSHYLHQIRRFRKQQAPPPDPDHPWRSTLQDP
jgi:hypothetical protein